MQQRNKAKEVGFKRTQLLLGVNIDHVATLRQVRGQSTRYPDPVEAVYAAENGGADGITLHLREDRRHIQERDIELIQRILNTRLNLEMAVTDAMIAYAIKIRPEHVCLVPEKREELTTEGGLDIIAHKTKIQEATTELKKHDIQVSGFIDPDINQLEAALECGMPAIELHTGTYAEAKTKVESKQELNNLKQATLWAGQKGLIVNAGHGLNYHNVSAIACLPYINELNIGHAIMARAIFSGLTNAVREMKDIMLRASLFQELTS